MKNKTAKAAFYVMAATLLSKILGFAREILLGSKFGTTYITDAYLIATTIPVVIFTSVATAISTTYVPVYSKIIQKYNKQKGIEFTNNLLNIVMIASTIICLLGLVFTKYIVSIIGMGFDSKTLELATQLTRIAFPMIIFIGVVYIFKAFLNSENEFTVPALIGLPSNIIIIISLMFSDYFKVYGLLYATVLGSFLQIVIQYPYAKLKGFKYSFFMNIKDKQIKNIGSLALPVMLGVSIQQINTLVDRILASGLPEGSIAALNFANKLNGFVFGIFSLSIATVIYPLLAQANAKNDNALFNRTLITAMNVITLIMLPITVGAVVLRVPIVSLLFQRGLFDDRATILTASALLYYALGMIFFGYIDILNRAFYSLHDTKTPMICSVIGLTINIFFNIILVKYMAHSGLALATSLSAIITAILLSLNLKIKFKYTGEMEVIKVLIKALIAVFIMGIWTYYNYYHFLYEKTTQLVNLIITIGSGAFLYLVLICIFRVEEMSQMLDILSNRLGGILKLTKK